MKVLEDIIAFKWIRPKDSNSLIMSDEFYKVNLRPVELYQGEAVKVGSNVKHIIPGDRFFIEEYSIENFNGAWKEEQMYFVKESEIKIKLLESFEGHIRVIPSESWNNLK
jgi:hypothetical protein